MTAADKLRELLATRPAMPNVEELTRWWRESVPLVTELLDGIDAAKPAVGAELRDFVVAVGAVALDLEASDCDLVAARAALRREQDARAQLRVELNARIDWQTSAVAHLQTWSRLFDAAVAMREGHEGCVTEPACGDCFRCRFDAAVDEAMKAVAAHSPDWVIERAKERARG